MTKPNKPQLSEEMEKRLTAEIKLLLYEYNQTNDDSRIANVVECVDDIIATAIEEERERVLDAVLEWVISHYWDSLEKDKSLILLHIQAILSILKKEKQS